MNGVQEINHEWDRGWKNKELIILTNGDNPASVVKLCCRSMNEAKAALGVLREYFRDTDEELLLWKHVVRYHRTRASWSAHDLR